jgi:hypothetical protein
VVDEPVGSEESESANQESHAHFLGPNQGSFRDQLIGDGTEQCTGAKAHDHADGAIFQLAFSEQEPNQ